MNLGFTGTHHGMNRSQLDMFLETLEYICITNTLDEFHVGDCIGADEQAFLILTKHYPKCKTHGHIPQVSTSRAFCRYDVTYKPKPYLVRNHDIVDSSHVLIAAPYRNQEELRSGTWATVRYARGLGREIIMLRP